MKLEVVEEDIVPERESLEGSEQTFHKISDSPQECSTDKTA